MKKETLKKELSLLDVYAVGTGATLSAGFFLLPGLAAVEAGPALVLSYLIAALSFVPATCSMLELATAMPRAGGIYYFLDRSLGPLAGTIGGLGTWLAMALKISFALVGMGAYVALFVGHELPWLPSALAIGLGFVSLFGTRHSGMLQLVLVVIVVGALTIFTTAGVLRVEPAHFAGFFDRGAAAVFSTAGLVYVSYLGVTKVVSLAEEIKNPERNLPLGTFLSLGTAVVIYTLGTFVMVGVVPPAELHGNLTPAASTAERLAGPTGVVLISVVAMLAFLSVANAGLMSASRYPLAMGRDHLLPSGLRRLNSHGIPQASVILTVAVIVAIIVFFNPLHIAKLASAFQLLLFAFACFAVIVMRESRIASYDPGFPSPLYPWMQILGIVGSCALIIEMGVGPALFSLALITASAVWYLCYARSRIDRRGAILHVFERLGRDRFEGLDAELRAIMKEKGLRVSDPFAPVVERASVIEVGQAASFESVVDAAAERFATRLDRPAALLARRFLEGTRVGATPVEHGIAIPHLRLPGIEHAELVLVRATAGIDVTRGTALDPGAPAAQVFALFFLVSPDGNAAQHLRLLARIAARAEEPDFIAAWELARGPEALKQVLLGTEQPARTTTKA